MKLATKKLVSWLFYFLPAVSIGEHKKLQFKFKVFLGLNKVKEEQYN
jgi:hypothetical protein